MALHGSQCVLTDYFADSFVQENVACVFDVAVT